MLTRQQILETVVAALEPLPYVNALWEGGAAAFGRADAWSDIDIHLDVADDRVEDVFQVIEGALKGLSPINLSYAVPQPTWHGHAQRFYRLADASPFHLVDVAVMKNSSPNKFLEIERHGQAVVHFDRAGVVQPPPFDPVVLQQQLKARLAELRVRFDLFQIQVRKELKRGNDLDALVFYQAMTLRPLVEVLRIQHQPARHDFGPRYLAYDFPPDQFEELTNLYFVRDLEDLQLKLLLAERWFDQALAEAERAILKMN